MNNFARARTESPCEPVDGSHECSSHHLNHIAHEKHFGVDRTGKLPNGWQTGSNPDRVMRVGTEKFKCSYVRVLRHDAEAIPTRILLTVYRTAFPLRKRNLSGHDQRPPNAPVNR
jgi:hypothetical protein